MSWGGTRLSQTEQVASSSFFQQEVPGGRGEALRGTPVMGMGQSVGAHPGTPPYGYRRQGPVFGSPGR